jgi:hypothetical protein
MSTEVSTEAAVITETAEPTRKRKRSSTAAKLIQATALAAVLVPLGSVMMEGASITCGFSGGSSSGGCTQTGNQQVYNFDQTASAEDDYKIVLEFFGMSNPFQMTVEDHHLSHEDFAARNGLDETYGGSYDCVDMVSPLLSTDGSPCREFEFRLEDWTTTQWDHFTVSIVWDYNSEPTYPNGVDPPGTEPGAVRLAQNKGGSQVGDFTIDMCLEALEDEAFDACEYEAVPTGDPRIGGGNTDFSTLSAVHQVPEPSSVILLVSGAGAALYRRRRRTQVA